MTDWYVEPNGSPSAAGTVEDPWDIASTLVNTGDIQPGDTVWIRGGTYIHTDRSVGTYGYYVNLQGASGTPVVVRAYPGERATIDGGLQTAGAAVPQHVIIRDLEIIVSENLTQTRISSYTTPPLDLLRPTGGINFTKGNDVLIVNNVIHHNTVNGCGFWGAVSGDSKFYGNIVYENGYVGTDRNHGHGLYTQNPDNPPTHSDWKYAENNIFLEHFSLGIQAYGSSVSYVVNYQLKKNLIGKSQDDKRCVLLGGSGYNDMVELLETFAYGGGGGGLDVGYESGVYTGQATAKDNVIWGAGYSMGAYWDTRIETNNFEWPTYWENPRLDGQEISIPSLPYTRCQLNTYDALRAYLAVMPFNGEQQVVVDVSELLSPGDHYKLIDPLDFYGEPLRRGVYSGQLTVPAFGEFRTFVLFKDTHRSSRQTWDPNPIQTYLSTEISSLANDAYYLGAKIDNVADGENDMFFAVEMILADQSAVRDAGGHVDIYMLPSVDDTNFCFGDSDGDPRPPKHARITRLWTDPTTVGRLVTDHNLPLPPFDFKLMVHNKTGQAFASAGNTLKYRIYSPLAR